MKQLLLIFAFFPLLTFANTEIELVYLRQPISTITLADGARLADLLHDPRLPADIYWRSAQVANPAKIAAMQVAKKQLLIDLKTLQVRWMRGQHGDLVQSSQTLLREIDRMPVSGRLKAVLDPATVRIDAEHNALLRGHYTLFMAPRARFIYFVGLINGRNKQPLQMGASLADYWQEYRLLAGADEGEAYLIQPDGTISREPVATWNELHREPMAGATLFVGFDPDLLPTEFKNINLRIANLIANRVPE